MPYHFKLATPFASEFSHKRDLTRHAEKFFETHQEFGIRDASKELSLFKSHSDPHFPGRRTLHFRQQVRGMPVFGAALKVHMDEQAQITMVDGNFVPDLAKNMKNVLSMEPIDAEVAKTIAIEFAKAEIATGVDEYWQVISANLSIYREGLFNGRPGDNHFTWLCIVVNSERPNIKEQVFVEAISGKVINNIPLIHNVQVINRQVSPPTFLFSFLSSRSRIHLCLHSFYNRLGMVFTIRAVPSGMKEIVSPLPVLKPTLG